MSNLKKKFGRRILAYLLSGAMIMSGSMTAFASEPSQNTGGGYAYKQVADADDAESAEEAVEAEEALESKDNNSNGNDDEKASSDEAVKETVEETEGEDSGQTTEKQTSDDERTSETKSFLSAEKEEKEEKASEADNKEALTNGIQLYNKHNPNTSLSTFSDLTFIGFGDPISNDHGPQTSQANATIAFVAPGASSEKVDIEVVMCKYGAGTVTVESGEKVISESVKDAKNEDGSKKYTILGVAGGSTATLTIPESGAYVHSIKATIREKDYRTIVSGDANGTASVSPVYAAAGDTVTLTAAPNNGYKLDKWEVISPADNKPEITADSTDANKAVFTMPAGDVEISAVFAVDAGATYDIHVLNGYHGTASLKTGQGTGISKDAEVILADVVEAAPDEGYTFKEWYVTNDQETAEDVTVTDGKFNMPASSVYVIPIFTGAAEGTYDFKNNNKKDRVKGSQMGDFSGIITFEEGGFKDENNDHGFKTNKTNAAMTLTLSDQATVIVDTCQWSSPSTGLTAKIGETEYTPKTGVSAKDSGKTYTITTDKGGELTLTLAAANNYIHSIEVQYGNEPAAVIEDNTSIDFGSLTGYNKNDPVTTLAAYKGFKFDGIKWNDAAHGLSGGANSTITLNLKENAKAEITLLVCNSYGTMTNTTIDATADGKPLIVAKRTEAGVENGAPKYTVVGAEGEATLKITSSGTVYIHRIDVQYSTEDKYIVTVSDDGHGTASADPIIATAGQEVALTAEPDRAWGLKEWQVLSGEGLVSNVAITDNKFTMPAGHVSIRAVFELTGHRTEWNFATDTTLTGSDGKKLEGEAGTVAELDIDATDGKWDSTVTDGWVQVNRGTTITVSLEGVESEECEDGKYRVTVIGKTADYTVDGKAATAAERPQSFVCDGTDGKAVIEMTADSHIGYIKVEPLEYVEKGAKPFKRVAAKDLKFKGIIFDSTIEAIGDSHGILTKQGDTEILLSLSAKADVIVETCCYNAGTRADMTASSGELTKVEWVEEKELSGLRYNVKGAAAGDLILTFGTDVYIHSISVGYPKEIAPGSRNIDVWDFGGLLEKDETTYTNNITPENFIVKDIVAGGLFKADGNASFEDLTMFYNKDDRLYTNVAALSSIAQKDKELYVREYPDGYTAAGGFYCNGTGGGGRRYLTIENVQAGDKIVAYMGLTDKASQFFFEGTGAASAQKDSVDADKEAGIKGFQKYEFVAEYTGTYKLWENAIGKPMYQRIVRVPGVQVSGSIDFGSYTGTGYLVKFVNKTNRKETIAVVDGTSYTAVLAPGFTYTAILSGAPGYGFTADSKTVEVSDAEYKTGKTGVELVVEAKDVFTYSGKLVGFAEAYDTTALTITMTPPEDSESDAVPLTIDENLDFTAVLEQGVDYSIQLAGVDDYEVKGEQTINRTEDYSKDIIVGLKPMYPVSGGFIGLSDTAQVAELTFTILNEKGKPESRYVYDAEISGGRYSINLRDGAYLAKAAVQGYSTQTHVVVDGASVEKDLLFASTTTEKESIDWAADIYVGYPSRENNYDTMRDALDACERMKPQPADEEHRITVHIAPGTYREQIMVNTPYVSFVNDEPGKTVLLTWYYGIGYKYYSADDTGYYNPQNAYDRFDKHIAATWGVTVYVKSGATAFRAEGITFESSFNRYITDEELADGVEIDSLRFERKYGVDVESSAATERAAAMIVEADRAEFKDCGFYSSQDTLYTAEKGIHGYFKNCVIEGNIDYIYGGGDYVFDGCELSWKGYSGAGKGGYITAARPTDGNKGYLFRNCIVTGNEGYTVEPGYFGRPWGGNAKVVLLNTKLEKEAMITAEGWAQMSGNPPEKASFFEYNTTTTDGAAVNTSERVRGVIDAEAAAEYTAEAFFGGWTPAYYQAEAEGEVAFAKTPVLTSSGDLSAPHPGHTLTVQYSLGAENDVNDASMLQWYRVEDGSDTLIKTANASDKAYQLTKEDVGKKLKVTVIPAVFSGKKGEAASYTLETAVLEGYDETVEFSVTPSITSNSNVNAPHPGDVLTAKYALDAANHAKDASVIKWYRVKDGVEAFLEERIAPNKTYTLTAEDAGYCIRIEVTPKNANGSTGKAQAYTMQNAVTEKNMMPINPDTVSDPTVNIPTGTQVRPNTEITLSCETKDAEIYYTLDGETAPSRMTGSLYEEPIVLTADTTIMAVAVKTGWLDSGVVTFTYTVSANAPTVYPPTANIPTGTKVDPNTEIILSCVPEDARIYYTLDGTTAPSETTGTLYEKPIVLTADTTIMAVAVKDGEASEVSTFVYTVSTTTEDPSIPDDETGDTEETKISAFPESPNAEISVADKSKITIEAADLVETGKTQYAVTVTYTYKDKDGRTYQQQLTEGVHYTAAFVKTYNGISGDQKLNISGTGVKTDLGTFINTRTAAYTIKSKEDAKKDPAHDISKAKFELDKNEVKNAVYTGAYVTPKVNAPSGIDAKDYSVVYRDNVNAGKASVTIIGKRESGYFGSRTLTFSIKKADLSKQTLAITAGNAAKIDGSGKSYTAGEFTYGGKPITFTGLTIKLGDVTLSPRVDYTVAYKKNAQKGKATAVIKGINNLSGAVNITYDIKPVDVAAALNKLTEPLPAEYSAKGARLSTITVNDVILKEGTDYKVNYKGCDAKELNAVGTVTVTGAGSYKAASFKNVSVGIKVGKGTYHIKDNTVVDTAKTKGDPAKTLNAAKITDAAGVKVKPADVKVVMTSNTITVTPNDTEHYEEAALSCRVASKLGSVKPKDKNAKIANKYFDGVNAVTVTEKEIENAGVLNGVKAEDIRIVSYKNNTKLGSATVIVEGRETSSFYGTKSLKFKIVKAELGELKTDGVEVLDTFN